MIRKRYVSASKLKDDFIYNISNEERLLELEVVRDAMLHVDNINERWNLADSFMLILRDMIGTRLPDGSRNDLFYQTKNCMYDLAEHGLPNDADDEYLKAVDLALAKVKKAMHVELEPA
jgi:hypothetical protein